MNNNFLGERVKARRIELNLTQDELAKRLGYKSRSSINKIECGRPVTQKIIVRLAEELYTTPAYLMGWDEITVTPQQELYNFIELNNFTTDEIDDLRNYAQFLLSKRGND